MPHAPRLRRLRAEISTNLPSPCSLMSPQQTISSFCHPLHPCPETQSRPARPAHIDSSHPCLPRQPHTRVAFVSCPTSTSPSPYWRFSNSSLFPPSTMYQQPNHSFESGSRILSNNPFRQDVTGSSNISGGLVRSSNSTFDDWVKKNKQLMDLLEEEDLPLTRPAFPTQSRTGSDSDVNYRYVLIF